MTLAPWDYLFKSFNSANFPDLFHPTWIAALVLLVVLTILYNVRTRALHRHAVAVADVDVGHQRLAAPMSVSGSHVAIPGKKHRITIASIMHPT